MKTNKQENFNKKLQGSLRTSGRGYGYFRSAEVEDFIEISPEDLNTALDLDKVEVNIIGHTRDGDLKGVVTKIIKRRFDRRTQTKKSYFYADDFRFYPRTDITNLDSFKGLKDDKKVAVKLIS
jgi:exoribonuclease R